MFLLKVIKLLGHCLMFDLAEDLTCMYSMCLNMQTHIVNEIVMKVSKSFQKHF